MMCSKNALNIVDAYFGIQFQQYQRVTFQENMPKPEEERPYLTQYPHWNITKAFTPLSLLLPPFVDEDVFPPAFPWFIIPVAVPSGMWNKMHGDSLPEWRLQINQLISETSLAKVVFILQWVSYFMGTSITSLFIFH